MSGVFTYDEDGRRTPFDPRAVHLAGCIICGGRVADVGLFVPTDPDMIAAVLKLRQHTPRSGSTSCVAYGLCARCGDRADVTDLVEDAIEAAAAKVVVQ